jgi:hypothetical protein
MDSETTSVATVSSRIEAELLAGLLISNGVSAVVSADDVGGQDPALQLFGVHILVAKSDEASAREVLASVQEAPGSGGAGEGD